MDTELLTAFKNGDREKIKELVGQAENPFPSRTPQGNSVLHLAARFRKENIVQEILGLQPSLLSETNRNGETPMHVAARAGDAGIIKIFIDYIMKAIVSENDMEAHATILRMKDNDGNTALHNAVRNGHEDVIWILVKMDCDHILYVNNAGQSPLSTAINASFSDIACRIISSFPDTLQHTGPDEQTLLHSAVISQDFVVMVAILTTKGELVTQLDKHERNPLHYAATSGNVEIALRLLEEDDSLAYQGDCKGQTPLHLATEKGHLSVLEMLINHYPDAIEVLDNEHRNILHIAAQCGHGDLLLSVLKFPEMEDFVNLPDKNGNTPLHLANFYGHSDVVDLLSKNKSVMNFQTTDKNQQERPNEDEDEDEDEGKSSKGPSDKESEIWDKKDQNKTLLMISTLIATFTFTAAFTIPGGFNNDDPDKGMATLVKRPGFQAFIITDTIAMGLAMSAAVISFYQISFKSDNLSSLAAKLTTWAIVSMSLAYGTGLYVICLNHKPLAIAVCAFAVTLAFTSCMALMGNPFSRSFFEASD